MWYSSAWSYSVYTMKIHEFSNPLEAKQFTGARTCLGARQHRAGCEGSEGVEGPGVLLESGGAGRGGQEAGGEGRREGASTWARRNTWTAGEAARPGWENSGAGAQGWVGGTLTQPQPLACPCPSPVVTQAGRVSAYL